MKSINDVIRDLPDDRRLAIARRVTALEMADQPPDPPDELHPSHETRFSDASTFDEICVNCGATDIAGGGWGRLRYPCQGSSHKG